MALGAQREEMLRMILSQSMRLVLIGVVVGIGTALLATRVISNLLYGVGPNDLRRICSSFCYSLWRL